MLYQLELLAYLVWRCGVCDRQNLQYFLSSKRSGCSLVFRVEA